MTKNKVGQALKIIAYIVLIIGIIGSFIMGSIFETTIVIGNYTHSKYNWGLVVSVMISSIILAIFLFALAEIIHLLQANLDNNKEIAHKIDNLSNYTEQIKDNTSKSKYTSKIEEIEANLPEI